MKTEKNISFFVTTIIITLWAIFFASKIECQELNPETDLWGYELIFYEVEIDSTVLQITQGDTLQIRWDAPVLRVPYDEQPDYPLKGNYTGIYHQYLVPNDSIDYNGNNEYNKIIPLKAGKYELKIKAIDINAPYIEDPIDYENYFSKESEGFVFEVIAVPPGVPARVYIIVRE